MERDRLNSPEFREYPRVAFTAVVRTRQVITWSPEVFPLTGMGCQAFTAEVVDDTEDAEATAVDQ